MYSRHRERQGGFGKAVLIFSVSLVGVLAIGLGLAGVFGGKDDPRSKPAVTAQRTPPPSNTIVPPVSGPDLQVTEPADPMPMKAQVVSTTPLTSMLRNVSYDEAEAAYQEKDYDTALDLFTAYTEEHPGNAWGHYMFGLSAWKAGSPRDAVIGFESAIRIDPRHVKSRRNLARVLLDEGRPGEALTQALEATSLDSTQGEGFRLVGRCRHNLGRPEEAITAYRKAVSLDLNDAWAMNNLGLLLIERERFDEALPPLAAAVSVQPNTVIFQNNLGIALERTGRFEAAAEAYRAALDVDDTNRKVLANLTRVEPLTDVPGTIPVDLGELASRFLDGVDRDTTETTTLASEVEN